MTTNAKFYTGTRHVYDFTTWWETATHREIRIKIQYEKCNTREIFKALTTVSISSFLHGEELDLEM